MGVNKTEAIVIKTMDYRDTSLLATFFTENFGKLKAVVKGGRDGKYHYGSTLEPFSLNEIIFYERRSGDLHLVTGAELIERFDPIRRNLGTLGQATYFLELVDQMTETSVSHPDIFYLLKEVFYFLSKPSDAKRTARVFEIKFMQSLGLMPELGSCVRCAQPQQAPVAFSIASGGIVCEVCRRGEGPLVLLSRDAIQFLDEARRRPLKESDQLPYSQDVAQKVERLLRKFVDYHLGTKPKSLTFLEKVDVA